MIRPATPFISQRRPTDPKGLRYAAETPPQRACSSAVGPHRFAGPGATPPKPCHAERVASQHARIALPALRLQNSENAALPGRTWCRLLRHRTFTHDINIHSFDPHLSFYFLFQLLDWPVGSNSLSDPARVPLGPPAGECVALVHPDIITGFWNTRESNVDHG